MNQEYVFSLCILIIFACLIMPLSKAFYITVFFSAFDRLAVFNVMNSSIHLYQILGGIVLIKWLVLSFRKKLAVSKGINRLSLFILYAGVSIFFARYSEDVYVINVNDMYSLVKFGVQQFTQYVYLLFSGFFCVVSYDLLRKRLVVISGLYKTLIVTYIFVILLGYIQFLIPNEVFDTIFRNSNVGVQNQIIGGKLRISSVFSEPSFLSLFISPILVLALWNVIKKYKVVENVLLVAIAIPVVLNNQSSSVVLGVLVFCVFIILDFFSKNGRRVVLKKRRVIYLFGILLINLSLLFSVWGKLIVVWRKFVYKISAGGVSGMVRMKSIRIMIEAFKQHPLLGVGFGTSRGYDLGSTWLAEIGIVGVVLYIFFIGYIINGLVKQNTEVTKDVLLLILVSNTIMFCSVSEFMQPFVWLYLGMGVFLVEHNEKRVGI